MVFRKYPQFPNDQTFVSYETMADMGVTEMYPGMEFIARRLNNRLSRYVIEELQEAGVIATLTKIVDVRGHYGPR